MSFLIELFPIIALFAAYKYFGDFVIASGFMMAAAVIQLAYYRIAHGTVTRQQLFVGILILVAGGLTLAFGDGAFVRHKTTVIYVVFGSVILISNFIGKQPYLEKMVGEKFPAPSAAWRKATFALSGFFYSMAAANHYVATHYSEGTWLNFKLFGLTAASFIFMTAVIGYLYSQIPAELREKLFEDEQPKDQP